MCTAHALQVSPGGRRCHRRETRRGPRAYAWLLATGNTQTPGTREIFYRGWLQSRLEVLYGRWPAIVASSLLFAAMHTSHVRPEAPLLGVAFWVIVFIHTVTNLVLVPLRIALL
ncbi:CPBP family intramembrane glutamic endopeptidase [Nonomuraea lactucae]|uniref:CPBP family intramembrane glutamic endopeptidase n=1 Tax=Nonomuraea lactucae TaxID=2249762 RepID=UPI000DE3CB34|nr:CPBP family intramembrane glutamic endopeptidase [Nonomuraea lactucae]